jgi:hypothetical protein
VATGAPVVATSARQPTTGASAATTRASVVTTQASVATTQASVATTLAAKPRRKELYIVVLSTAMKLTRSQAQADSVVAAGRDRGEEVSHVRPD